MRNLGGPERSWFHAVLCSVEASGRLVDIMGRLLEAPGGLETPCFHAVFLSGLKVGCASLGAGKVVFRGTLMFDSGMTMMMQLDTGEYVRLGRHHIARLLHEWWQKRKNNEWHRNCNNQDTIALSGVSV